MNKFEPLQDTVNLLSGAKIRRAPRPEERFELEETFELTESPRYSTRIQAWLLSSLNRFRLKSQSVEKCSGEGEINAPQTTTP